MFRSLALLALGLLFALLASEAFLRLARVEAALERPTHTGLDWLVSDPLLGYRNQPRFEGHGWRIDSLGFRGPEVSERKPPGTLRIVCIGDSGTFGLWKHEAGEEVVSKLAWDAYPDALARELPERTRRPVEVINAGVVGYTTAHGLRQLVTRIVALDPDVVTVRLGLNDFGIARVPAFVLREPHTPLLRFLFYRGAELASFRLAAYAYRRLPFSDPAAAGSRATPLPEFERNLQRFVDVARAARIRLAFLDYPIRPLERDEPHDLRPLFFFGFEDPRDLYEMHGVYQQAVKRVASERGVPFVDTTTELARSAVPAFSPYDRFHPNDTGARRIGQILSERLLALDWVESQGREEP